MRFTYRKKGLQLKKMNLKYYNLDAQTCNSICFVEYCEPFSGS